MQKKLRFEIFKRDNFTCQYCGRQVPDCVLEIDHILPKAEGGTDDPNNLITSCFDCNRGKGRIKLSKSAIKANREEEIFEITEREEQIREYEKFLRTQKAKETRRLNNVCKYIDENIYLDEWYLNDNGKKSILRFLESLTPTEIREAVDIAVSKIIIPYSREEFPSTNAGYGKFKQTIEPYSDKRFRYFCGVCHNKIAAKKGDTGRLIYGKIKRYWLSQKRGSGYFVDWQLKEICRSYSEEEIIDAINEAHSEHRGNYWDAFLKMLGVNE